jgi:hypothetical protein
MQHWAVYPQRALALRNQKSPKAAADLVRLLLSSLEVAPVASRYRSSRLLSPGANIPDTVADRGRGSRQRY